MSRGWIVALVSAAIFCLVGADLIGRALSWWIDFSGIFAS